MSRTLRAELLRAQNQPREALAALGVAAVPPDNVLPFILSYPLAHERWLRAELLHQLKQDDEALRWYGTFPDPSPYDRRTTGSRRASRRACSRRSVASQSTR